MAGHDNIPTLAEQVSRVPTQPGCYLWKDAKGDVIYVGKAKNLRARMRQYVTLQDERQKIPLMMQLVASFDYIVVETEHEALVLERNLIGQYHPYFNVDLKDDKSYPFIAITKGDLYPAIKYTRERHKPGTRYFGPYTDSRAARETIDTLRKVIPICSASCAEWRRCRRIVESHKGEEDIVNMICAQNGRPCFDYHVGRGPGACVGAISPTDYAKNVKRVERFLSGHRKDVVDELTSEMTDAAEALDTLQIAEGVGIGRHREGLLVRHDPLFAHGLSKTFDAADAAARAARHRAAAVLELPEAFGRNREVHLDAAAAGLAHLAGIEMRGVGNDALGKREAEREFFEHRGRGHHDGVRDAVVDKRNGNLLCHPVERRLVCIHAKDLDLAGPQTLDAAHGDGHAGPRLNGGRKRVFGLVQISASHVRLPCVSCQRRLVAEILILRLPCPQRRSDRRAQAPS